jgi:hypothetical protein
VDALMTRRPLAHNRQAGADATVQASLRRVWALRDAEREPTRAAIHHPVEQHPGLRAQPD